MTTYSVDLKTETQTSRTGLGIDYTKGGALTAPTQPTPNSKSYGSNSRFNPPSGATQAKRIDGSGNYGNPMRTHVDVKATEVPGSKHQTLGNKARVAASNAKGALGKTAGMAGRLGGRVSPGVGINAKGDIDFGLRAGGAGVSLSVKGDISLGVPGLSATVSPRNGDTTVDIGFGGMTIESTRVGCSITVTVKLAGKIINQDTRQADDCVEPEPTPSPTPTPTPTPTPSPSPSPSPNPDPNAGNTTNNDDLSVPDPGTFDPPSGSVGWFCPVYVIKTKQNCKWVYSHSVKKGEKIGNYVGNYYDADYDMYYMDYGLSDPEVGGAGYAEAGKILDLSREEKGKFKESGYLHYYAIGDPFSMYYPVGNGRTLPKPYAGNGWKYSQGVPELTFGYIRYYNRVASTDANKPLYSFGDFIDPACILIMNPYHPDAVKPYQTKPRAIPPMDDKKCCEMNNRIYEMLGGDEFYKNGLTLPNSLYIPGGAGDTKAETYNGLINLLFRTLAYRTPGNIEVKLKDSNIMKPGQQPLTYKPTDATSYYNKLMEVSMSQDSDLSALLNLLVRLNWIAVQILNLTTKINYSTKALLGFFGVPTREKIENVDIPVDPSLGEAVGFENKKPNIDEIIKKLDKDDPKETRNILDKFMNATKIPVVIKSLVSTAQGGNYWWLLDKNKR